jgi:NADH-quinone oxidoreductase subunit N
VATPFTVHVPQIRWLAILPELIMLGGAVLLLAVASLVRRPLRLAVATGMTVVIALTAFGFSWWQWADVQSRGPSTAIDHAIALDGFSVLVNVLVTSAVALSALIGDGYLRREGVSGTEYHILALISASGAMIMGAANDLVLIFLGLEILSIALYVLVALNYRRGASGEAGLKYFVLGSFSSAIFVYGIALTYGATGSTNLTQIADFFSRNVVATNGVLLAGMVLLLVGFAFKVAAVPFHMWTPDVYQGAPSPVTGFMAAVAKAGAFAALLRVFVSTFGTLQSEWRPILYALAVLTLVLGAVFGLVQRDIKRMLAYSSINHAGFVLVGVQAATVQGVSASLYYLFTYTFMVIGSFGIIAVLGRKGDGAHDIAGYRGMARRQPYAALALAILLLAQAGAPFTTGFLAKLQVVQASIDASSVPLAVIAMVTAAVATFFYLRVAVLMYTPYRHLGERPGEEPPAEELAPEGVAPEEQELTAAASSAVAPDGSATSSNGHRAPLWSGIERSLEADTRINAEILLDRDPRTLEPAERPGAVVVVDAPEVEVVPSGSVAVDLEEADAAERVRFPVATTVAVSVCLAVTVVFGVIPQPLIDFAHKATLLFFPS